MLFSDAVTEYMADKGKRLRATTLEGYRSAIRCHLMPMPRFLSNQTANGVPTIESCSTPSSEYETRKTVPSCANCTRDTECYRPVPCRIKATSVSST